MKKLAWIMTVGFLAPNFIFAVSGNNSSYHEENKTIARVALVLEEGGIPKAKAERWAGFSTAHGGRLTYHAGLMKLSAHQREGWFLKLKNDLAKETGVPAKYLAFDAWQRELI